jgi:hypothetical protein
MTTNITEDYLKISDPLQIDESVSEYNYHNYEPVVGSNLNSSSQIRIVIENQDLYYLPYKSFLTIKGKLTKTDGTALANTDAVTLINNGIMFLFSTIEYQIGDKVIEYINYPGHSSLMKGLLSYPNNFENSGLNMCWTLDTNDGEASLTTNDGFKKRHDKIVVKGNGNFSFVIPLSHIFGFCEDYKKVIYGVKHSLILTRIGNEDAIFGNNTSNVTLSNITWNMINIIPNFEQLYPLNKMIESKSTYNIGFMYRNLDQIDVSISNEFTWRVGSRQASEKPRYIIIGFQTNRSKNNNNPARFDNCNVRTIYVELNAIKYPNIDIINNFGEEDYSFTYYLAKEFREKYYGLNDNYNDFMIEQNDFKTLYPLFVFDVSKQSERLKNSISDITIRAKFNSNVKANTKCYCLILSDRVMKLKSDGSRMIIDY